MVSIPSEVGRGRAPGTIPPTRIIVSDVSIPSEVGRGRAPSWRASAWADAFRFQSPRRWGGVGLVAWAECGDEEDFTGFNPLGGGAGSGSPVRVRPHRERAERFNPLGGGAGSGSQRSVLIRENIGTNGFNPLGGGAGSGSGAGSVGG